jgi:sulfur carrier protein ThiS
MNIRSNMQITVKLFGGYRTGRFKEAVQEYPDGASCGDLLQSLGIGEVRGILLVNGNSATQALLLNDGDTLTLFPLVSGG